MAAEKRRDTQAYIRVDGNGRVVAGSIIFRKSKPKIGHWIEVPEYECCNDITSTTSTTTTTP